ncbi:MAG: hypothetical protein LC630_04335 [Bacteroidales bacterium]|nr:hypothetical protein [Bacteroidales bacterium]
MNNYQNHPLAGAADLDSAMTKLWSFYKKYFIGLYIISVVLALISSLITSGLDLASMQGTTDPSELLEILKSSAGPYALMMLISLVFGVLLHAWVLEKPMVETDFLPILLKKSLVALFPYLAVMIIFTVIAVVLTTIGLILLVLPAFFAIFYIATVMLFALPLTLIESRNPIKVVDRSFRLAHSHLWPNMGWVIVLILIVVVASLVIGALVMLPFTGSFIKSMTNPEEAGAMLEMSRNPLYIGLSALLTSLITPVMPILAFILYFRNRGDEVMAEIITEIEPAVRVEDLYPPMPGRE